MKYKNQNIKNNYVKVVNEKDEEDEDLEINQIIKNIENNLTDKFNRIDYIIYLLNKLRLHLRNINILYAGNQGEYIDNYNESIRQTFIEIQTEFYSFQKLEYPNIK